MHQLLRALRKKFTIRIPVWAFIVFVFFLYAAWEILWYTQVGLRVVHWHTHFAIYLYLWAAGTLLFLCLPTKLFPSKGLNGFLLFSSLIFALLSIEIYLTLAGQLKTYMEKVTGYYTSPYAPQDKSLYHAWPPGKEHYITKPEYSFWRPTNSFGLPDVQWPVAKKRGEKRILALGDSFTEGDGACYDSSYVSLLKRKLLAGGDTFYVMNGGVCGSDPFFNYVELKDHLLKYRPDIILQSLSTQDLLTDILLRGGMERFRKDGTLQFRPGPWWEPLYAVSYISRLYFRSKGYTELLRPKHPSLAEVAQLDADITALFKSYIDLCREENIDLVIVLRPDQLEIVQKKYDYDFAPILHSIQTNEHVRIYDLLPCYLDYIAGSHSNPNEYFWKTDGHHNGKGYEMMAQCIYDKLQPALKDSTETSFPVSHQLVSLPAKP